MIDYSKTVIYKICCKDTSINDIYIGSTYNFARRKAQHKFSCNKETCKEYNYKVYQFIRDNGGWDNFSMIMIHEASVENKLQKEKLEREYIEEMKPTLNNNIPTRTLKEYREANKEKKKEHQKHYYEANKEKFNQKFNCECGGKYTTVHKERHIKTKKHQAFVSLQ